MFRRIYPNPWLPVVSVSPASSEAHGTLVLEVLWRQMANLNWGCRNTKLLPKVADASVRIHMVWKLNG